VLTSDICIDMIVWIEGLAVICLGRQLSKLGIIGLRMLRKIAVSGYVRILELAQSAVGKLIV
jgi:hypothetical protein